MQEPLKFSSISHKTTSLLNFPSTKFIYIGTMQKIHLSKKLQKTRCRTIQRQQKGKIIKKYNTIYHLPSKYTLSIKIH